MILKRLFDITFSFVTLFLLGWILILGYLLASVDTRSHGLFLQQRVGQFGRPFYIFKLRTMHPKSMSISRFGRFLRNYKIDEWPQLVNILIGNMSFVGPRPDIMGYYDLLTGENKKILELKPGLTSEASIKYYNEEALLRGQENPTHYNDTVIFPDKVKINLNYYHNQSFWLDLNIIIRTVFYSKRR